MKVFSKSGVLKKRNIMTYKNLNLCVQSLEKTDRSRSKKSVKDQQSDKYLDPISKKV